MWTDDWIGIPYRELGRGPEAYDCLGLFLALQRQRHGRNLHDPLCSMSEAVRRQVAQENSDMWRKVDTAREGDAVLIYVTGRALHVGYALDDRSMLHVETDVGAVIEEFTGLGFAARLEGVYRYAG
jgi:cell wall-associated NlpC family hydrolase